MPSFPAFSPPSASFSLSRRAWLCGAAAMAASAALGPTRTAKAIGPLAQLRLLRLNWPGLGHSRDSGLFTLAQTLRVQTSTDVALDILELGIDDARFLTLPLAVVIGDRKPMRLSDKDAARLKGWLESGGTLFVDTMGGTPAGDDFDAGFRREIERIFPRSPLFRVPAEHVLYRSFYRLDYPAGRVIAKPFVEAVSLEGRLAVIYSQNDAVGAWCRDSLGRWEFDVRPGGEPQREIAIRFGVNVVQYTLCQDYKDDQVHIDYLLRKRKWKIDVPKATP